MSHANQAILAGITTPEIWVQMGLFIINIFHSSPTLTRPYQLALPTQKYGMGWDYFSISISCLCPMSTQPYWLICYQSRNMGWDGIIFIINIFHLCPRPARPHWLTLPTQKYGLVVGKWGWWHVFITICFCSKPVRPRLLALSTQKYRLATHFSKWGW